MDINSDPTQYRGSPGFPIDQPMEALKKDHEIVRQLFDRYLNTRDVEVKRQAAPQIFSLLELHTSLEEATFYPAVRQVDASLVDEGEEEHHEAKRMIEQLKGMQPGDPQCDQMMQQLCDAVMHHVQEEEQKLFPEVERANLDLSAIGLQMQMFESNAVAAQAKASERPGMR
jgi:hemerythrin superfamily protein